MLGLRNLATIGMAVAVVIVLGGFVSADAKEAATAGNSEKFAAKDLPAAVIAAFQKGYPKATIKDADREMKDSTLYYEIESLDGKTERSLLYLPDGTIFEIEEGIDASTLPALVKSSIVKEYPQGKIEKAEKITRGIITEYEVEVQAGKDTFEVVLDSTGKVIKTEKRAAQNDEDAEEEDSDNE